MTARIYQPARTAMQSGTAKTKEWVLDYEPETARLKPEVSVGWVEPLRNPSCSLQAW